MIDLRQSLNYSRYMQSNGWTVKKIPQFIYIRKIPLLGSIIKIQRPQWPIDFKKIDAFAKKDNALFVKLEPQQLNNETMKQLDNNGFRQDKWPLLPPKTIHLDLTKSEKQLLKEMAKDTHYCLKKAENKDIKILRYYDIESFHEALKQFGKGYIPKKKEFQSLINTFAKNALLLVAKKKIEVFAGAVFLITRKTAYYFYAFTSPEGRKNFSQYLIVWRAIKELKKHKLKILDLEGIEDPRFQFTKKWRGFSHFKKSFGGEEITFPGSFTKYYHPLLRFFKMMFLVILFL